MSANESQTHGNSDVNANEVIAVEEQQQDELKQKEKSGGSDANKSELTVDSNVKNTQDFQTKLLKRQRKAEERLRYGAMNVIRLFIPISVCMLVVVITVQAVPFYTEPDKDRVFITAPFSEDSKNLKNRLFSALANVLVFTTVLIVATFVVIILYKYRCTACLYGWLMFAFGIILSAFTLVFVLEFSKEYQILLDYITMIVITWNICVTGLISIFWKAPLILQQAFLVFVSSMIALIYIKYLPLWTTWLLLGVLVVWDLVAVLCPGGPLRMLVELAKERKEPIMAPLIYTSIVCIEILEIHFNTDIDTDSEESQIQEQQHETEQETTGNEANAEKDIQTEAETKNEKDLETEQNFTDIVTHEETDGNTLTNVDTKKENVSETEQNFTQKSLKSKQMKGKKDGAKVKDRGVKLGIGDFIFYSVLMGRASTRGDWNTTLACYVAILTGLSFTLILLAVLRTALPALPISLTFGIVFYFCTSIFVQPFADAISESQIYI
ncbi:hypothetical protein B4U80_10735 [Leptotrombidium deliense]|uniref:Presenilin n=1 Tax=Leptotrombidium deliense TaxID=299467 RepID=A0A443ST47_9ACAR|nr:hypothetical protein B4U80_10735 [Leptotrombidium deliense]